MVTWVELSFEKKSAVLDQQGVAQKNPFVIDTVTQMCKNRLPLNIILTTTAVWHLPAEFWVIPVPMCSLAGLMNVTPTDDVYLPVRPVRIRSLNQKSNVKLSRHSVHDEYQTVKLPDVLVPAVLYCINGKMKLSVTVFTK
uniref:Transportase n=1 Tax=Escherichia coli TaxID=562 RepID=A0A0B4N3P1_ECOLX|nr:transportase [Escherichia coli]